VGGVGTGSNSRSTGLSPVCRPPKGAQSPGLAHSEAGPSAANDGKVVFADPLGIYGNCIVVDHGYGLQSIEGVKVNPVEWWDGHWLQDRIWSKAPPPAK